MYNCHSISSPYKRQGKHKKLTTRKGKSKQNKGKGKGKGKRKQEESDDENCAMCYNTYKDGEDWICCDTNLEDLKGSRFYTIMIIQIYYTSAFFFYMKF
jgi:hypothetical protein